jgi:hypothetical protein
MHIAPAKPAHRIPDQPHLSIEIPAADANQ